MKGIILCGGYGTRLKPLTLTTNKHLIPVFDKQMMCYPLMTLKNMGIKNIQVVLGGENIDSFIKFLKDGSQFGLKLSFVYQKEAGGIMQAIGLCEDFVGNDTFVQILGDNMFLGSLKKFKENYENSKAFCGLVFKRVKNPKDYGIVSIENNRITDITEKPDYPTSDIALTGLCIFNPQIFNIIRKMKPSPRGELELSRAISMLLEEEKEIYWEMFKGEWVDCGSSIEGLFEAGIKVKKYNNSDSNPKN